MAKYVIESAQRHFVLFRKIIFLQIILKTGLTKKEIVKAKKKIYSFPRMWREVARRRWDIFSKAVFFNPGSADPEVPPTLQRVPWKSYK